MTAKAAPMGNRITYHQFQLLMKLRFPTNVANEVRAATEAPMTPRTATATRYRESGEGLFQLQPKRWVEDITLRVGDAVPGACATVLAGTCTTDGHMTTNT